MRSGEAHDVEILIFHPDSSDEAAVFRIFHRLHVNDPATNLPKSLPTNKLERVVRTIEAVQVRKQRLGKSDGGEGRRIPNYLPFPGLLPTFLIYKCPSGRVTPTQIQTAQEIVVASG